MAVPSLAELIKDSHVRFGSNVWDKNKVSADNLKKAIVANPSLLIKGWTVNGAGQIVRSSNPPATSPGNGGNQQPKPSAPSTPVGVTTPQPAAPPPQPDLRPLTFKDSQYWMDWDAANRELRSRTDPLNAELASLQDTTKYGGQTLYDFMYQQAQDKWFQGVRSARDQAARAGALRSGRTQRNLLDMDGDLRNQQMQLNDTYWSGRINRLTTEIANANSLFNDPSGGTFANIARAARQRAIENEQRRIEATYGMTIDPSRFQWQAE